MYWAGTSGAKGQRRYASTVPRKTAPVFEVFEPAVHTVLEFNCEGHFHRRYPLPTYSRAPY
jgi:hypothetical protein